MHVEELKNNTEWEDFLKVTPRGTFYHSTKWRTVIERSFSNPTVYLVIRSENGRLVGVCPTSIVTASHLRILESLPHSDFGGPIIERRYIKEASLSLQRFIEEFSQEKGISLSKMCFLKDTYEKYFETSHCHVNNSMGIVELDLRVKPSALIWEKIFRYKHRRKIKSFERDGFQVREASTKSDLRTFLTLYYQNMKHLGELGHPSKFFENVWNLLYPENFSILLVEKSKTVGGVAFFKYNQTIYLTYFGMDRELPSTMMSRYSIAPFLCWSSIKWAEENGFRYVCFGSTPAYLKSESERANYSNKIMFGGSFLQQETLYIPFNFHAFATLLLGSKIIKAWKAVRDVFPLKFQKTIEHELGGMF
jgi:CelD/BcsL family acetyltransferase involved in cellulose biosynthesis